MSNPPLDEEREIYPDLRVFESRPAKSAASPRKQPGISGAAAVEPIILPCPEEERVETFIQVVDRSAGNRVVTVIELLLPSNKLRGDSRRKYREKQQELYEAKVNLVEIDLTRGGRRRFLVPQSRIPARHPTTFQACVYRAMGRHRRFEVYEMPLTEPLPAIGVPLREADADVWIELQPWSSAPMRAALTTTSITPRRRSRRCKGPMPRGPTRCSGPPAADDWSTRLPWRPFDVPRVGHPEKYKEVRSTSAAVF